MKLQTASRLAIYAVLELAEVPGRQLSAAEIGEKYDISTHHLAKVLHTLGRAGLVHSVRGAGGGYTFSGNAKQTTLLDIISLFEPIDATQTTATEPGDHTAQGIALRNILTEIDEITQATLNSITVSTLLKQAASKTTVQQA